MHHLGFESLSFNKSNETIWLIKHWIWCTEPINMVQYYLSFSKNPINEIHDEAQRIELIQTESQIKTYKSVFIGLSTILAVLTIVPFLITIGFNRSYGGGKEEEHEFPALEVITAGTILVQITCLIGFYRESKWIIGCSICLSFIALVSNVLGLLAIVFNGVVWILVTGVLFSTIASFTFLYFSLLMFCLIIRREELLN